MRPIHYILTFFIVLCAISFVNASNDLERKHIITRSILSDSSSSSKTTSKTEPIFALVVVIALGSLMF
ncbi:hypothetical protein BCV72DRAFT_236913 [Rhizopus microsporus var. microsporus]|uniref:Uncharacterized protein n=2 Tax=Rhizopus microsporus TaxID=58291 RepID=A0A2G4SY62_RHIZD|nr:uncharacterized protein RHIMIDRAFT_280297 [Rhizopus microsporus ATCC 52813]ORE01125.1 hypothetical protein BCV72DRAFT_236913 [Rhizopus microsporus var. microsporus]PHZ13723.1 hypothetical protein RHIMIDRAFT_280297 [Rhizopus microsporus ATCC 52813]